MTIRKLVCFLLCVAILVSCRNGKTRRTDSGMKYILYTDNKGVKPVLGDYVTFEMVYKTEEDSVLFDSRINKAPFRIQLSHIPFRGSMEEGLTYLSEGDSATFFVSADSLLKNLFSKRGSNAKGSVLKPGSTVKFDVRLIRVQLKADAEREIAANLDRRKKAEQEKLKEYIQQNNMVVAPDSNGIFLITDKLYTGKIKDGDSVSVYYASRYLNGVMFDSNMRPKNPVVFALGSHQVIRGWEVAFKNLRAGSKATLIVPSSMAYGEEGLLNASNGSYIVPPYTPLVFEVEIASVKQ